MSPVTRGVRSALRKCCVVIGAAPLLCSFPASAASAAGAAQSADLEEIVVIAARMRAPLLVTTDPKRPRQPLPAHDGADYLKAIPGFSVIRKGGTDGDPVFRGMAASRVNILIDGQQILGGCGNRMDPPTAYVFPEAYDRIVVIKGPQTVLHGPGNSAASVSFERDIKRYAEPDLDGTASALAGSFGRTDLVGDLRAGTPNVYGRLTGTRAESDDYTDGDGADVHSRYMRWSGNGAVGWTPGDRTLLELSGALSNGEAAYADRAMDGVKFDRENVALRFERKALGEHVTKLEAQAYYNYVDHVMDNYSLRDFTASMTMPNPSVSNPDRRTAGGKVQADLSFGHDVTATVGVDLQENRHTLRSTMNETTMPYESMSRVEDARFRNAGLFGEMKVPVGEGGRVIAGLRADDWYAKDARQMLSLGMTRVANPTAGDERNQTLFGGFGRYERDLSTSPVTLYAGVGHVERFPDYWELISATKESATSLSAFNTRPEKTTQLDIGALYASSRLSLSVSMFLSDVQDFILIQSNYRKGMRYATISRNVDARTWGGEADALYKVTDHLKLTATLAYTRGDNRTDDAPLAQIPPLEGRLGLDYTRGKWSVGTLFRAVDNQDRYVVNQGNIVGQDLGPTPGFAVLSLNAGWHPSKTVLVTAGIDNLFDRTYAEHLSRSGAMVPGYLQTTRVNEPGQTLWMKVNLTY